MHIRVIVQADNPGNDDLRRAFIHRNSVWLKRGEELAEVLRVTPNMAYRICEPLGEFGSGSPSLVAAYYEVIRKRAEIDLAERCDPPLSLELAHGAVRWARRCLNGSAGRGDIQRTLAEINLHVATAISEAGGRQQGEMSINDLNKIRDELASLWTHAEQGMALIDAEIRRKEAQASGVPMIGDKKARQAV
ncbi:MAG TPA: hypothetical protein VK421_06255 [Pyrinomonadaceae bacterium]|nr:hypothetical protein [Pyrinomonadaceae bacterium]